MRRLFFALLLLTACPAEPPSPAPVAPSSGLPEAGLAPLQSALAEVDKISAALAADRLEAAPALAESAAVALDRAAVALDEPARTAAVDAAAAARHLAAASDLAAARASFGELNATLFPLIAADPRLQDGRHSFSCPMTSGFQSWFQADSQLQNPYFGAAMLTCGAPTGWGAPLDAHAGGHDPSEVLFHTCPMHPAVKQAAPGTCPLCGMDLVPVTRAEAEGGVVRVDAARRQAFGVRLEEVALKPLVERLRLNGQVVVDERRESAFSLLVGGQVRVLHVDHVGQRVRAGDPVLAVYDPAWLAAQEELLAVRGGPRAEAARRKLRLWGMDDAQIAKIEAEGRALDAVTLRAPSSGVVVEKDVVLGQYVDAGATLLRLAPLDPLWVEVAIYEADAPWVRVGQAVEVVGPGGERRAGRVEQLLPTLDPSTRTRAARLSVPNADGAWAPGMYAEALVQVGEGEGIVVSDEAILYLGDRRVVFVDEGEDRLAPRELRLGRRVDGGYEVLEGLAPGERVVVSGNFLVAAESRIRSGALMGAGGAHGAR